MYTTVQIVQRLSPGGIETIALDFAKHTDNNEENFIISLEGSREEMLEKWPRLKAYRNQIFFINKPNKFCLSTVFRLGKLIKRLKANCVHTHHIGPLIYGCLAGYIAFTKKHLHTEHDAWHLENTKHKIIQKVLLNVFRPTLIADSNLVADRLKTTLGLKTVNTIHNGIDTDKFNIGDKRAARQKLQLPINRTVIGCAGRLEEVKGQSVLINALLNLPKDVHMALAGVGSLEAELKALVQKLGVSDRVHFLGLVEDMPSFYQSLDLFCLPSHNEGFPLSPLEAQACGIPCVITDTGASAEAICPDLCHLVSTGNSSLMAEKLMLLLPEVVQGYTAGDHLQQRADDFVQNENSRRVREFVVNLAGINLMLGSYRELKLSY